MGENNEVQLKRRYELECSLDCLNHSPLIGLTVFIYKHGAGTIQHQDRRLTRIAFNNGSVTFDADEVDSSFFDFINEPAVRYELAQLGKEDDLGATPIQLMLQIFDCWRKWNLDIDKALIERVPALMKYPWIGMNEEWKLFTELKKKIDKQDWNNLPLLLSSIYHGELPQLEKTQYIEEIQRREMIRTQVKQEIKEKLERNTIKTINRIVEKREEEEKREAKRIEEQERKDAFVSYLNEQFRIDFFSTEKLCIPILFDTV